MNWQEALQNIKFEITTGDGLVYKPLWQVSSKNIKYNTEGFDFIGIEGTYVERSKRSGPQYPMTFFFQGADCIQQANRFELSARDRRAWKIKHPFLGEFKGQPLDLTFDYSSYNVVKVSGVVWQTISRKYPQEQLLVDEEINSLKYTIDGKMTIKLTKSIVRLSTSNIQTATDAVASANTKYKLLVQTETQAADLRNRVRLAVSGAENILSDIENYTRQALNLINFPFTLSGNIDSRIDRIIELIESLGDVFLGTDNDKDKELYDFQSTIALSSLCQNVVNESFDTISQVLGVIDKISNVYDLFLSNIDNADYTQNSDIANDLDLIINSTIANLFDIAFDSKQERRVLIDKDNNLIVLAHKYYGPGDDNLEEFISKNNIKASEYLGLSKGREIVYFV